MINHVTLVGRLVKNPILKKTKDGKSVVNVTVAVNRHYRNRLGEYNTDFVLCTLWNKIAENTEKYCQKGSIVGIVGKIQTRNYDNSEGKRVYVTEVLGESIQFLSKNDRQAKEEMDESVFSPVEAILP
ncbi:single-stranded DNA-binding protein [Bacillus spongiae]|uniref:Single-stranded DNA-binding protein n=1 Tax=Bacillus spongiae TaxID=2683610 RepID=A0ABU8HIM8_9BACI